MEESKKPDQIREKATTPGQENNTSLHWLELRYFCHGGHQHTDTRNHYTEWTGLFHALPAFGYKDSGYVLKYMDLWGKSDSFLDICEGAWIRLSVTILCHALKILHIIIIRQ